MEKLDRRQFLLRSAAFLGFGSLMLFDQGCSEVETQKRLEIPYTVEELKQFGKQLNEWRLTNGTLMSAKFPEIKKYAQFLSGNLDPKQFFPFIRIPIGLSIFTNPETASLVMQRISDPNDPRRIVVTTKEGKVLNAPILAKNTPVDFTMSQDILDSSIRLPILAKEVSQLIDYPDYSRAFVNYLKSVYGISVSLQNPNNIPTSEDEVFISIANNIALENAIAGKQVFRAFVDNSSFLRTGIAFANWYQDQLQQGLKPEGRLVETGVKTTDFLKQTGLIKQERDIYVWSSSAQPPINDNKFLDLVNEFSLIK